jgi:3(or 17)beta-hydroxysteroid dehydrogenase
MRLENKVALVTGGAIGIGKSIVELFHKEGAKVIVTDINDVEGRQVAKDFSCEYYHLDVSKAEDWEIVFKEIKTRYKRLDVLVNNAGLMGFATGNGPFDPENFDEESWHKIHSVNLDGTALGCKYAISAMKNNGGGSIVNVSSRSGIVGVPGAAAYASSKAAVRNHTKSVALYCAEKNYNIRCNSIHPAAILTLMWDPMLGQGKDREKALKAISDEIPLKRMGMPLDVAYGVLYLATDESSYVTGIELNIDGGILAGSSAAVKKHN